MFHPTDFFDLTHSLTNAFFSTCQYIWEGLPRIQSHVQTWTHGKQTILGKVMAGVHLSDRPIYIAEGARIEPGAYILGPAYIGAGAIVRHGAFVRENVILLDHSILGHASEAKNSLFLPHAHAPHFNYVGDSILGNHVNLGAGTKLSNLAMNSQKDPLTSKRPTITLTVEGQRYDMGVPKMGAIMGDNAKTGCNAVLNPGCLVGRSVMIYPNLSLRKAYYPPHQIIKLRQTIRQIKHKHKE